jgi:transcriptional regulator with XRE-family HTH domain
MEKPDQLKAIGGRIREARTRAGYSQHALAVIAGTQAPAIWRYEQGKVEPSATMMAALARALRVTTEWLVYGADAGVRANASDEAPESFRFWLEQRRPTPPLAPEELETLASVRFKGREPSTVFYDLMLQGLRYSLPAEDAKRAAEQTERVHKRRVSRRTKKQDH